MVISTQEKQFELCLCYHYTVLSSLDKETSFTHTLVLMSGTAYLILENGTIFEGKYFGAQGNITGEIVFTTGMTGYLETLTDPSYYGQIVLQTFPLIGNYGVIPPDFESGNISARAYIVKHPCENPSNFRSEKSLDAFLKERGIIGLYGIDTRALTKIIRENGVMNGKISSSTPTDADFAEVKAYSVVNAVASVSSHNVEKTEKGAAALHLWILAQSAASRLLFRRGTVKCGHSLTIRRLRIF